MTDSNNNTIVNNVTYNAANQLLTMNGETRSYNVLNQLTNITSGSVENLTYNYPAGANNGKIGSMYNAVSGETITYTYDSLNRLSTASDCTNVSGCPPGTVQWAEQYTFDPFGNLTTKNVTGGSGPSLSQAVNANNQIVGGSYDNNGNTGTATNNGNSYNLGYDAENRLSSIYYSPLGETLEYYGYDTQNRRIWSWPGTQDSLNNTTSYTVNAYTPSGQKLGAYLFVPATTTNGGAIVPILQVTLTSTDKYFGARRLATIDQLGSSLSSSGSSFFPWGEAKGGYNPQDTWNFATYWQDSTTALDYANNRYYSNAYGRFMTPDPSTSNADPKNPQSWNFYAYVNGDPVNMTDPTGLYAAGEDGDDDDDDDGGGGQPPPSQPQRQKTPPPDCDQLLTRNLQTFLQKNDASLLAWDPNLAMQLVAEGILVGIDPRLFASIATLESAHGTKFNNNNPFGLGQKGSKQYGSPQAAIGAEGSTLQKLINSYGETSVSALYSGAGFVTVPGKPWQVLQYPAYCYGSNAQGIADCQAAGVTISGFLSSQLGDSAAHLTPGNPNNLAFPCPE